MRLILLLCVAALAAGCAPAPPAGPATSPPSATPAGGAETPIEAAAGETFTIALDANPSTGYAWALAEPLDEAIVQLVDTAYQAPANPMPGAGGSEVWTFRAVGPGSARITLGYARPWEADTPPAETRVYSVTVR